MLTLDVGCGRPRKDGRRKKRGDIGIDLHRGLCDVVADAQHLPFCDDIFGRVFLYAILEHLDDPLKCLIDVKRVAKKGAYIEILFPVESHIILDYAKSMVMEFPFSISSVVRKLWGDYKFIGVKGYFHKNRIQPRHISDFFQIESVEVRGIPYHHWFLGRKGKILRKIVKNPPLGARKDYFILARHQ